MLIVNEDKLLTLNKDLLIAWACSLDHSSYWFHSEIVFFDISGWTTVLDLQPTNFL